MTIADVARLANASKATVSRVLTGNAPVNPETKSRVLSVISQYGYVPNRYAQCLAGTPARIIGVVVGELANFFFTEVVEGIDAILSEKNYSMLLGFTNWDVDKELGTVKTLLHDKVDGVILSATSPSSPAINILKESGIPFVVVNCIPEDENITCVSGDNYAGGKIIADFINGSSYSRVLLMPGFNDQPMSLRTDGLTEHLCPDIEVIYSDDIPTAGEGLRFGKIFKDELLCKSGALVVFASNDNVAIGLENGISREIRIPEDVSIIGYDDIIPSSFCRVPLTTVSQNMKLMGQTAAELLLGIISGSEIQEKRVLIAPRLIIRESTR